MQAILNSRYPIMGGQVCVEDTRIPAAQIMREFESGRTVSDVIYSYPSISEEAAKTLKALVEDIKDE